MSGIIWNVIGLFSWIFISCQLYLKLEDVDMWLAICGAISGLHVVESCIKDIRKWRRDV